VTAHPIHAVVLDEPVEGRAVMQLETECRVEPEIGALRIGPAPLTTSNAEAQFASVLNQELSLDKLIQGDPGVPALQDDRPVNEYFIVRRVQDPEYLHRVWRRFLARVGIKA